MPDDSCCLDCGKVPIGLGGARGLCKSCYYKRRRRGTLGELPKRNLSFEEHLAQIVPDENGCWLWPGFVNWGQYGMTNRHTLTHVHSYRHHIGLVPKKHDVGHLCHDKDPDCQDWRTCLHRRCINPDHLIAQTRSENLRSRPWVKSHCIRGHELSPENVQINKTSGARQCMLCVRLLRAEKRQLKALERELTRPYAVVPIPRPMSDTPLAAPSQEAP